MHTESANYTLSLSKHFGMLSFGSGILLPTVFFIIPHPLVAVIWMLYLTLTLTANLTILLILIYIVCRYHYRKEFIFQVLLQLLCVGIAFGAVVLLLSE